MFTVSYLYHVFPNLQNFLEIKRYHVHLAAL